MQLIDEALIKAIYGTRSEELQSALTAQKLSRVRPVRQEDNKTLNALSVQTRLDRVYEEPPYPEFQHDYDNLCEFLHPNIGRNVILLFPSARGGSFAKVTRIDPGNNWGLHSAHQQDQWPQQRKEPSVHLTRSRLHLAKRFTVDWCRIQVGYIRSLGATDDDVSRISAQLIAEGKKSQTREVVIA